jgi:hypothetical protein
MFAISSGSGLGAAKPRSARSGVGEAPSGRVVLGHLRRLTLRNAAAHEAPRACGAGGRVHWLSKIM